MNHIRVEALGKKSMRSVLVVSKSIGNSDEAKAHEEPRHKLTVYCKLYFSDVKMYSYIIIRRKRCTTPYHVPYQPSHRTLSSL